MLKQRVIVRFHEVLVAIGLGGNYTYRKGRHYFSFTDKIKNTTNCEGLVTYDDSSDHAAKVNFIAGEPYKSISSILKYQPIVVLKAGCALHIGDRHYEMKC